jgi:cytochrome c553
MIVGQYTNYLMKQMKAFLNAERAHDEESPKEGALYKLKEQDLQDILAYLTTLQNQE